MDGCPICHDLGEHDLKYFFWFFNETYLEAYILDGLTRSLGFCRTHAAELTRTWGGAYQLAAGHCILVRRVRKLLSELLSERAEPDPPQRRLTSYDSCPPCRSRDESAAREAFWMARILENPGEDDRYGQPGLLCFPHLRAVVPRTSRPVLDRLLTVHDEAMRGALKSLADVRSGLDGMVPSPQELRDALLPPLRLAVGHEAPTALPSLAEAPRTGRGKDPVGDLLEALGRGVACPICLECRRAWIEWGRWLDAAVPRGSDVGDLLPTCPEHVWALVRQGGPDLAVAAAAHALRVRAGVVEQAARTLGSPSPSNLRRPLERLTEALVGPRRREQQARGGLVRVPPCPLCRRLATAEDRTLALLFAVMEDRYHRPVIDGGYGLCLKHLARALALDPAPAARRALLEIEGAKLARLQWELEEAMRKVGWEWRPEAAGTEASAWRRAVVKFSGSFAE
jgi:hypothetical protein